MPTVADLLQQARELPDEDRWELGRALLEDLESDSPQVDPQVASSWQEIARNRLEAYDAGEPAIPLPEAWRRLFNEEYS
jgi:hypothetical protein